MAKDTTVAPIWDSYRAAARLFFRGATVVSATPIAAVVGTWLSLLNQGSAILDGRPPWLKLALNYATPFVVASSGSSPPVAAGTSRDSAGSSTTSGDRRTARRYVPIGRRPHAETKQYQRGEREHA